MAGEKVELVEAAPVDQVVDALAGRELALVVLAAEAFGVAMGGIVFALAEPVDLLLDRVDVFLEGHPAQTSSGGSYSPNTWRSRPAHSPTVA